MRGHSCILAVVVAGALLSASATSAEPRTEAKPDVVAGQVVRVDAARSRVTVRSASGELFEFTASAETLKGLKPGDRIEATKRSTGK